MHDLTLSFVLHEAPAVVWCSVSTAAEAKYAPNTCSRTTSKTIEQRCVIN